jgi:hypothetical protein
MEDLIHMFETRIGIISFCLTVGVIVLMAILKKPDLPKE